jgi:hypothetical protein
LGAITQLQVLNEGIFMIRLSACNGGRKTGPVWTAIAGNSVTACGARRDCRTI